MLYPGCASNGCKDGEPCKKHGPQKDFSKKIHGEVFNCSECYKEHLDSVMHFYSPKNPNNSLLE